MLSAKTKWVQKEKNEEVANLLASELSITNMTANLLTSRGITTVQEAKKFLYIENQEFYDPFLLEGMEKAVQRIKLAIQKEETILVYGDYDADGVSSTTIMIKALKELGASVEFYIPNRFNEGYGPNKNAFQWASDEGYGLIITVDTGISAINEAKFASELGIDLIITDHHEPGPVLPEAFSIIHPNLPGGRYPFKYLAGAGVALKVAHALLGDNISEYIAIASIGTIADLVPLFDENRLIAARGIKALRSSGNLGVKALLKVCSIEQAELSEESIGFSIAPRINAAGRLGDADPAVHLFLTDDAEEAELIAEEINTLNQERQKIVNEITIEAIELVESQFPLEENQVLIIGKKGWNAGVIGIVASRLVDKFYRPTIVLSLDEEKGEAKGSARSIEGFDLFENLSTCRDILPHFGGHTMAAGMTVKIDDIDDLRSRLIKLANEQLTEENFIPATFFDIECCLEDITINTIEQLGRLAPYGMGNPKPKVVIQSSSLSQVKKIGQTQNHLKLLIENSGSFVDGIAFGFGHLYEDISPLSKVSILGELSINEWNNHRKPQVLVGDICIEEWQLFDWRGSRSAIKQIGSIPVNRRKLIAFNEKTITDLELSELQDTIFVIKEDSNIKTIPLNQDYIILLDLPPSLSILNDLVKQINPKRIYTLFSQQETHFFNTIPTREHFKWFYGFLTKNKEFHYESQAEKLSKHRGWSKETIQFMFKVFFELEFVTINNGVITLTNQPIKRDLTDSKTYMEKQDLLEIEKVLVYSSYSQLKDWFDHVLDGLVTT